MNLPNSNQPLLPEHARYLSFEGGGGNKMKQLLKEFGKLLPLILLVFFYSCKPLTKSSEVDPPKAEPMFWDEYNRQAYYIEFNDTAIWNGSLENNLFMLNPIIKIQLNKKNDINYFYKQADSAILFANNIGFYKAAFIAGIISFEPTQKYSSKFDQFMQSYLDTASWIPDFDEYLRNNHFVFLSSSLLGGHYFSVFKTETDCYNFEENLRTDSIAYLVFLIQRIPEVNDSIFYQRFYPTYGGKKSEIDGWK